MPRKSAKPHLVLLAASLLLLALGLLLNLWWTAQDGFYLSLWLLNFVPGCWLLLTRYLISRTARRRWLWRSMGVLLTVLLVIIIIFINWLGYSFVNSFKPITDIEQYAEVRAQLSDTECTQHFPPNIPPEATEAKFHYWLGAMQGEMSLQLRLALPITMIRSRTAYLAPQAQYQISAAKLNSPEFEQSVFVPVFFVGDRDTRQFPDTYTLLFLSDPDMALFSCGVAFSESPSEIVYWLEDGT